MVGPPGEETPDTEVVARSRKMLYAIALGAGVGGLIFTVWLATMVGSYLAVAQADATTTGTITETGIEEHRSQEDRSYTVSITYRYQVDGQNYTSSNVHPGNYEETYNVRSFAEAFLEKYPEGSETTVYYDSGNPSHSHLVDEPPAGNRVIIIFALTVALFGGSYLTANRARQLG